MNHGIETKDSAILNSQAAGTGTNTSSTLDMQGFEGVKVLVKFGTVVDGASLTLKVQQGDQSDGSDMSELAADNPVIPVAASHSEVMFRLDLHRPEKRYVRAQVIIATQNAEIDSVTAEQYGARKLPVTQLATVVDKVSISPAQV
jgi:hypothetical protein